MQKKNIIKIQYSVIVLLITSLLLFIPSKVQATEDVTSKFEDENFKNAILEIIRKVEGNEEKNNILLSDIDAITADTLPSGKQLNLAGKDITSLAGLELFASKGIEWIYLDWNQITDISVLENFQSLTKISASGNQITDITSITNLTNLQNINFSNNQINSITPILNLVNAKYLYLDNNQIQDITGISKLSNLKEISMSGNLISNIEELTKISTLESIDISRNKISSIQNIVQNTTLTKISLNYNILTKLEGVEKLSNLEVLSASNNKITDISNIGTLSKLYNLNLNKNEIYDIEILKNNTALEYLYLDANHIMAVETIEELPKLKKVTIYNQLYNLDIMQEYETEQIKINLTSIFQNLKNSNSKLYNSNVTYKMDQDISYTIADDISFLILNLSDLEEQDLIFRMEDNNYSYITLVISYKIINDELNTSNPETNTQENEDTQTNTVEEDNIDKTPDDNTNTIPQSNIYKIENNYIKNIPAGTNIKKCMQNMNLSTGTITKDDKNLTDADIVGTGSILKVENKTYTMIVKQDTSGDGKVNIMDLMQVKRHITRTKLLNKNSIMAADVNEDGKVNIMDAMNIVKTIVK